jgi:hypothetical protein
MTSEASRIAPQPNTNRSHQGEMGGAEREYRILTHKIPNALDKGDERNLSGRAIKHGFTGKGLYPARPSWEDIVFLGNAPLALIVGIKEPDECVVHPAEVKNDKGVKIG